MLLGSVTLPGSPQLPDCNDAHTVLVVGNVAYVGNEYGLDEVDVSNPHAPIQRVRQATGFFVHKLSRAPDGRIFAFAQQAGTCVFTPLAVLPPTAAAKPIPTL